MKEELARFGINPTEQEVLLFLLRYGSKRAGLVASKLNLKRSTAYSALENLVKLKIVSKVKDGKQFAFRPAPAQEIPKILIKNEESRFAKLKLSAELLERPLAAFTHIARASLGNFDFELIESSEQYSEYMLANNADRDYLSVWDPNVSIYNDRTEGEMELFLRKSAATKNKIKEILVKGPKTEWYLTKIKNPNHQVKLMNISLVTTADLTLYEPSDTLISLMTPENESGLVVHNVELFNFFKQLFTYLWKSI